ncbi:unnamed protein product [Dovyalis caffra]|uniref:Uncharacterized protein n=1 Tax=Dovyalis caffra TaxID=77055 RepID=A0AAV1S8B8_9ROSI|nr:unnamed protein product [Dovyalis caffra]
MCNKVMVLKVRSSSRNQNCGVHCDNDRQRSTRKRTSALNRLGPGAVTFGPA